jgi:hypothetical protein
VLDFNLNKSENPENSIGNIDRYIINLDNIEKIDNENIKRFDKYYNSNINNLDIIYENSREYIISNQSSTKTFEL